MQIRRSTNWWVVVAAIALIASACGSDSTEQPVAGEQPVPTTAPLVQSVTPNPAPTVAAQAAAVATPPPAADDGIDAALGPLSDALINWSDAGVTIFKPDGTTRTVTTTATAFAVLFDSGLAVYQTSPYKIAIGSDDTLPGIVAAPGRALRLLAGEYINGEPMVLVSSRVEMPVGPDDAEERLFLIEARTGGRRDLGVIGGWESSVSIAQFGNDSIAMMRFVAAQAELIFVDLNGQIFERIQLQTEGDYAIAVQSGGAEVALLRQSSGEDSRPGLVIWTAALEPGATLERSEHSLTPDGVELDGGFCRLAAYTNDQTILCNRSTGSPIEIDLQDSYRTTTIEGMTSGAVAPAIRLEQSIQT